MHKGREFKTKQPLLFVTVGCLKATIVPGTLQPLGKFCSNKNGTHTSLHSVSIESVLLCKSHCRRFCSSGWPPALNPACQEQTCVPPHPTFQLSKLIVWGMFGDFKVKATQQTQNSHECKLCAYDFYIPNIYLQTI